MDGVTQQHRPKASSLFGADELPSIVGVERFGDRQVRLFQRGVDGVQNWLEPFRPWLVTTRDAPISMTSAVHDRENLGGSGQLAVRLRFDGWSSWHTTLRQLRDTGTPVLSFGSPTEQYLIDSGRGLFRNMQFDQLCRAQLDIETLGLDPAQPGARIIIITVSINGREPVVFRADEQSEREMIEALGTWLQQRDPDVIEGHNLFNFDLPFLAERAQQSGVALHWGRDGSAVRVAGEQRFKAGPRSIPFQSAFVYGRHFVDTYQQIQRYDSAGQLDAYGLKPAVVALGLGRADRALVAGDQISDAWRRDRAQLIRYAIDDVLDVNSLSELVVPTEFYQTQILPRGLQSSAIGGPGEKINDLLVRSYLAAGQSVPLPAASGEYPGGYAEVRQVGRFAPVVKCDVESLYPSIMLRDSIAPASDALGVFLPMLDVLTERRLHAKRMELQSSGVDRARWRGIQSSFKVLINSFYGYLGYGRAYFNDVAAARRVTLRGQEIVVQVVNELERRGALPIEVDTDGVFFQPPASLATEDHELALIDEVNSQLPSGIRLAHDGRYKGMLSLKLKNYALLEHDGRVVLKGSSLRSRREELYLRRFVRDAVSRLLSPDDFGPVRDYYLDTAEQIMSNALTIDEISRWETITDQTFRSESNRRLAEAIGHERIGERVNVYQRQDGTIARASTYDDDEDRGYLLRRLRDMAERFRPLYASDAAFNYDFPLITPRTDVNTLRQTAPATQLGLFEST